MDGFLVDLGNGRRKVKEKFTWAKIANVVETYNEVIENTELLEGRISSKR